MVLSDKLKALPTEECCGVLCWTPTIAAKAIGKHRNTINKWIKAAKRGEFDMPVLSPPTSGRRSYLPREKFLEWLGFKG